jgi:hypothetical protein
MSVFASNLLTAFETKINKFHAPESALTNGEQTPSRPNQRRTTQYYRVPVK